MKQLTISSNKRYLIIETTCKELCVYRFDDYVQISSVKLNDQIEQNCLLSNNEYISLKFEKHDHLITFKIIDNTLSRKERLF